MKERPRNESFADGGVGAGVRLMVRGGCLPVKGSERLVWKYDDCRCGYGPVEIEMDVLFECTLYGEERERWRGDVGDQKDGMDEYEINGSKRHSLQVVELSQQTRTAVQSVSNPPAPSNGGPIYRFLGMPAMRTRWMAGAAAHKSG